MHSNHELKRYSLSVVAFLLCLFPYSTTLTTSLRHGQMQKNLSEAVVRERIAVLMSETLREREKITPEGIRLWVPVPPPHEALQEVKGYGDKAVTILVEYLKSGSYHERELAMQLLSHFGGSNIVEPLLMVIRYDPEPRLREDALKYVSQLPWEVASPILRETSKADLDPRVREKAKYTLDQHEAFEVKTPSESFIRKRVAALMSYILKKGEGVTSDGAKYWMPRLARPSEEDIEEVRRYGDDAVPILSKYLSSEDGREKNLAMQFLGMLGGNRIISPLERIILNDPSPSMRQTALRWLTEAPWDRASPIIEQAAQNDLDPGVRQTAREILDSKKSR